MGFFDEYPYTNWHNVNLDWVLERVKEWGQMVEANNQAFQDLKEANASFKEYVTNYIENLNYQAAIDDKLDRMFESGVLGEYLQPYVSPVVTTWLDQHITEPEGVVIDSSLTVAGAAADSRAVGNRIVPLENAVLTTEARNALLDCFLHVAWEGTDGIDYYNRLAEVLNAEGWNYQWSAESQTLPYYMTTDNYNFTTEQGALYFIGGIINFEYTGNCILEIEAKNTNLRDNNPQFTIQNEIVSENLYRGISLIFSSALGTSQDHGMCAASINGEASLITRTNSNEYHTYRLTAINNVYSLSIDGENIPLTQNDNTTRYVARTGMYCGGGIAGFIRSIKFKRL